MAKIEQSVICVLVVVLSLSLVALAKNVTYGPFPIKGFYLVQQWYGSYCNEDSVHAECCYPKTRPTPSFTIYGLWPYDINLHFPSDCGGSSHDIVPIEPLEGRLQEAWPSFYCDSPGTDLWLRQWYIRGSCCQSLFNETVYFETSINLKTKIDIFQALSKVGIIPNNRFYPLGAIKKAVARVSNGIEPVVTCTDNKRGQNQLWRIAQCVDESGTNVIDCPFPPKDFDCTSKNILFPSYYPN
ncbi:hypothetical protein vseg_002044 [Gypsophila vaccaria]